MTGVDGLNNMDELDDFLDGEATGAPVAEEPQTVEETPSDDGNVTVQANRDDKGRFAPKGDTQEDAPPASDEKAKGLEAGISAERKKRQEAEQRYADLERQIAELREASKPQETEQPAPSLWEDENAWQQHFGSQVVGTAVQQATLNAKLDMSEMMARQAHEDFDAMKERFVKMMQENPALQQQAMSDPHPWNRAYQIAKNASTMEELGATDLDTLKAEIRKQIEAEQAEQQQQAAKPVIPQSLAGEQSARGGNPGASSANLSFEEIIGG